MSGSTLETSIGLRLIADTAVELSQSGDSLSPGSVLRVYTRDIGLAYGVRQLASQYKIKFRWHKGYTQGGTYGDANVS
ncbi:hypothetical protein ACOMICROBIO_GDFFDHBD_00102 [Vibrio sp. B1REV9]|nr:hypothetical protein ACOMICROBIO_GDFFDHBD_00102 [Vibrio sp. B1REV9]